LSLIVDARPTTLDEIAGNRATVSSLKKLLGRSELESVPHSFIFHGPSGCGKTTLARIVAGTLGCSKGDIIEINAGNMRGIDMVRDSICSKLAIPPICGTAVYLIDESHALTKQAMECLLKPVEDAPGHVWFFFCTTDLTKLLKTIRNRCTTYAVAPISDDEMIDLLLSVAERFAIKTDEETLVRIVSAAEGCPREGVKLLEQVAGLSSEQAVEVLQTYAGEEAEFIEICRMLSRPKAKRDGAFNQRWRSVFDHYSSLANKDPETLRRSILGYYKTCLLRANRDDEADRYCKIIDCFAEANVFTGGEAAFLSALYKACSV